MAIQTWKFPQGSRFNTDKDFKPVESDQGQAALIALCKRYTVTLFKSEEGAPNQRAYLNDTLPVARYWWCKNPAYCRSRKSREYEMFYREALLSRRPFLDDAAAEAIDMLAYHDRLLVVLEPIPTR